KEVEPSEEGLPCRVRSGVTPIFRVRFGNRRTEEQSWFHRGRRKPVAEVGIRLQQGRQIIDVEDSDFLGRQHGEKKAQPLVAASVGILTLLLRRGATSTIAMLFSVLCQPSPGARPASDPRHPTCPTRN